MMQVLLRLSWECLLSGVGTLCFAVLFGVPKKHWWFCAADGAVGWVVYSARLLVLPSKVMATLLAALPLAMLARIFAITRRAPATVFLLCGIFPLVPGAGIYYTAYYFMQGQNELCAATGIETLKIAIALALGMAISLGVPLSARLTGTKTEGEKKNMASKIKMLALDLDGTLTNSEKIITPRTKAALFAAMDKGVTVVLASGRPTVGIRPVAQQLELEKRGGCILAYNGGKIVDCKTGETLYQKQFPADVIPEMCAFAAEQDVALLSYNTEGVVTERPEDVWLLREAAINRIPAIRVENLAQYLDYPISKMLIALDPARIDAVEQAAKKRFAGKIDVFRSCDFFIELVPLGVAKDQSLAALLQGRGLTAENLMAVGDGMNDLSMIRYAGIGVAMANADPNVKAGANHITRADNDHDGVAEVVEEYILK